MSVYNLSMQDVAELGSVTYLEQDSGAEFACLNKILSRKRHSSFWVFPTVRIRRQFYKQNQYSKQVS